ncbi:MAG: HDOD domain-containing protein [Deltaproteobacteria bacterium]|nr:HDOD domain-containing protein [Deltaproteobacteria bacterium]MBW1793500.1 HDOD domain-containing protein [Deltaproteobacteria bacterium]
MDSRTFLKKLDRIPDIPTLPTVVFKVNKMLQDYDTSIKDLSKAIEKDQAIVSKILRLVNSAFYGFRSRINTIAHAVTILGFNTVRNAVVSVSIIDAFSSKDSAKGFDITDFWKHSLAVAVTSRYLADRTRLVTPDEAFVAGILHDVGKVVLAQYFKELFGQVWVATREQGLSFYEAEKKLLPVNHAQIGGHLAKKWQLPASLFEAISYHHAVMKSATHLNLLMVVHVADIIVNNYKSDSESEPDFSGIYPEAAKVMAPQLKSVSDWFPDVVTEIESACEFFLE